MQCHCCLNCSHNGGGQQGNSYKNKPQEISTHPRETGFKSSRYKIYVICYCLPKLACISYIKYTKVLVLMQVRTLWMLIFQVEFSSFMLDIVRVKQFFAGNSIVEFTILFNCRSTVGLKLIIQQKMIILDRQLLKDGYLPSVNQESDILVPSLKRVHCHCIAIIRRSNNVDNNNNNKELEFLNLSHQDQKIPCYYKATAG